MELNFIGGFPWEEEIQICTMKLILNGEGLVRGLKVGNWVNVQKFSSEEPRIKILMFAEQHHCNMYIDL